MKDHQQLETFVGVKQILQGIELAGQRLDRRLVIRLVATGKQLGVHGKSSWSLEEGDVMTLRFTGRNWLSRPMVGTNRRE